MLILWIRNSLTTYENHKLRYFKTSYVFNGQYDGVAKKMLHPDTQSRCSDIKTKLETMNMSQLKFWDPKENLQIA